MADVAASFEHLVGAVDGKEMPFTRHAFESMKAPVLKADARADDQVLHSARDQNFTSVCRARNTASNMNGNAAEISAYGFALAAVESSSDLDA